MLDHIFNMALGVGATNPFTPGINDIKQIINLCMYALYAITAVSLTARMGFLGFRYAHADNENQKAEIKKSMRDAVIGAGIVFGAALITNIITSLFQVFEKS